MSMITLQAQLVNIYQSNARKDRETGEMVSGKWKIQVIGHMPLENGGTQLDMKDLSCHDVALFKPYLTKTIKFPIGIMSSGNQIILYIPKGSKPELVSA